MFVEPRPLQEADDPLRRLQEGNLRIPYDRDLLDEFNTEKSQLTKTGRITYSHQEGTHDDRFWALALAVYAAEQAEPPPSIPMQEQCSLSMPARAEVNFETQPGFLSLPRNNWGN